MSRPRLDKVLRAEEMGRCDHHKLYSQSGVRVEDLRDLRAEEYHGCQGRRRLGVVRAKCMHDVLPIDVSQGVLEVMFRDRYADWVANDHGHQQFSAEPVSLASAPTKKTWPPTCPAGPVAPVVAAPLMGFCLLPR